ASQATGGSSTLTGRRTPACVASALYKMTVASGLTPGVTAAMYSSGYVHRIREPRPAWRRSSAGRPRASVAITSAVVGRTGRGGPLGSLAPAPDAGAVPPVRPAEAPG